MNEPKTAKLVLDVAGGAPRDVRLEGSVRFGRNPGNGHVFPEDQEAVSGVHATIVGERGRYLLRDEASTSGTFVNGHRVAERELRDGDLVEFGLDGPGGRFLIVPDDRPPARRGRPGLLERLGRALFGGRAG